MAYLGNNDIISRANNEAIEIPEQVAKNVISGAGGQSVVMQLARKVTLPSMSYRQPVLNVLPDAYWVNGDTGLKKTTKAGWDDAVITAEPLAALVVIPDDFLMDATVPLWGELQPLMSKAMGRAIDQAALWGINKPASWSESVYQHAVAAGNIVEMGAGGAGKADLGYDVAQVGLKLAEDGFQLNGFATEPGFKWRLAAQRNADGSPIYTNLVAENRNDLYGLPFVESTNGAWDQTVHAIGGDWSNAIVGIRSDMVLTLHRDAVITDDSGNVVFNAMQQDSTIGRFVMRVGFVVANPATYQNTTTTRSPFAVLVDEGSAS